LRCMTVIFARTLKDGNRLLRHLYGQPPDFNVVLARLRVSGSAAIDGPV
jgi:hypothetical protein